MCLEGWGFLGGMVWVLVYVFWEGGILRFGRKEKETWKKGIGKVVLVVLELGILELGLFYLV